MAKKTRVKMNFQIEEDVFEMSQVLKNKHFINLSCFFREALIRLYNKLEKNNATIEEIV